MKMPLNFLKNLPGLVVIAGIIATSIAFMSYAWLGLFSRYYADDLCMSGLVIEKGFWQAQISQYMTWSNRYAGMFTLSVSDFLGTGFIRYWTALVLVLLLASVAWAIGQLLNFLKLSLSKWAILLLAELVVFFTLLFSPNIYQDLFWRIGIITYTLPLVFLALMVGIVFNQAACFVVGKLPRNGMIALAVLAFFAGGFSETYVALQTGILALAWLAVFFFVKNDTRRAWLALISAGLAGSVLALAAVLLAPGNAVRRALMLPPPGLFALVRMTAHHTFLFMFGTLSASAFQMLLAFTMPLLIVYAILHGKPLPVWRPSGIIFAFLLTLVLAVVLTFGVMAPAAYAQSSYPDGRVLINAAFILALMLVIQGALAGLLLAQLHHFASDPAPAFLQITLSLILAGLLLYPLYPAYKNYQQVPVFSDRTATWDERDARIRAEKASGQLEIVEIGLNAPGGLAEINTNPADWVNACASQFYDVNSITVK